MPWVYLDDKFHANGKVLDAGNPATGLYARALSYCGDQLSDGFVRASWVRTAGTAKQAQTLEAVELWTPVKRGDVEQVETKRGTFTITMPADGYFIADYLALNPSKAEVDEKRRRQREGGKKGADARWTHGSTDGSPHGSNPSEPHSDLHTPLPQPLGPKEETPTRDAARAEGPFATQVGEEFLLLRIVAAMGGGETNRKKVDNALRRYKITEHGLRQTLDALNGPNVVDPVAVALAQLKKHRKAAA